MSDAAKSNAAAKPADATLAKADAAQPKELPSTGSAKPGAVPKEFDYAKTHEASAWKYERPLTACRFDPTGRFVFAGTEDYTIQRFNLADGKPTPLVGHESWARAIGFTPDGKTTFTGGYDGRLLFWKTDAEQPKPLRTIDAHVGWLRALAVSPDGKLVATCGNDNLVKLWSTADGKFVREFKGHESHVYNVAFHPLGKSLVSFDLKAVMHDWDVATGKSLRSFDAKKDLYRYSDTFRNDHGGARSFAFNADGTQLAAGCMTAVTNTFAGIGNPAVALVDWKEGKQKLLLGGKEKVTGTVWGLAWHPAGLWLGAVGGPTGYFYVWKPDAADEAFRLKLPDTARDMSLHPDGLRVAIAHADGNLRIYRLAAKAA